MEGAADITGKVATEAEHQEGADTEGSTTIVKGATKDTGSQSATSITMIFSESAGKMMLQLQNQYCH